MLNDICLPAAVNAASRCHLEVPRDVAFATVGDDVEVSVGDVRMTAVAFDWAALAKHAVTLLMERLEDLNRPPQTFTVPHTLRVRGLCGAPPTEWTSESVAPRNHAEGAYANGTYQVFSSRLTAEFSRGQSRSGDILI